MTRADVQLWRAALTAGVNAACDVLDAAARARARARGVVRPPALAENDGGPPPSELDMRRAQQVLDRHGVKT